MKEAKKGKKWMMVAVADDQLDKVVRQLFEQYNYRVPVQDFKDRLEGYNPQVVEMSDELLSGVWKKGLKSVYFYKIDEEMVLEEDCWTYEGPRCY